MVPRLQPEMKVTLDDIGERLLIIGGVGGAAIDKDVVGCIGIGNSVRVQRRSGRSEFGRTLINISLDALVAQVNLGK